MSSFAINPVFHGVGTDVWKQIANPAKPGTFLPSHYLGGQLEGAVAQGKGDITATWTVTGLNQGYYSVAFYYDAMPGNAKALTVSYKVTGATGFTALPGKLNETTGGADVAGAKPVNGVLPVNTVVTPYSTSNAKSYIWVPTVSGVTTLSIQLSDVGYVGGMMVADTIMLTFIGATK